MGNNGSNNLADGIPKVSTVNRFTQIIPTTH